MAAQKPASEASRLMASDCFPHPLRLPEEATARRRGTGVCPCWGTGPNRLGKITLPFRPAN
jgi:hypothetical protein